MTCLDCIHNNVCTAFSVYNDTIKEKMLENDYADKCIYFDDKYKLVYFAADLDTVYYKIIKNKKIKPFKFETRGEILTAMEYNLFGSTIFKSKYDAVHWLETHGKKSAFEKYKKKLFSKKVTAATAK